MGFSPQGADFSGHPTTPPASAEAWVGAVRTRLLGRALGIAWLGPLALALAGMGFSLVLDPGDGATRPLPWLGMLLWVATSVACVLTILWLGARIRRNPGAALRRLRGENAALAEEVASALELSSPTCEGFVEHCPKRLGAAFARCHRQEVEQQLRGVPPAALVPLSGVAQLGRVAALLLAALVLALAIVPEAPSRLRTYLGVAGGSDSLPFILRGPAAKPLRMELRPPGYTGIPPSIRAPAHAPTLVPEGSQVIVLLDADHPVEGIRAIAPGGKPVGGERLGESAIRVRFLATGEGELLTALKDPDGVWRIGATGPTFRLQRDRPPAVRVRSGIRWSDQGAEAPGPRGARRANTAEYSTDEERSGPGCIGGLSEQVISDRALRVRPDTPLFRMETAEPIALSWDARDDYGLTSVSLVYAVDGGKPTRVELARGPRFGPGRKLHLSGEHHWDLTSLFLGAGSRVRFHIEAEDNRSLPEAPTGGQTAASPSQEIRIEGSRQARREVLDGVRELLGSALDALADRYEHPWPPAAGEECRGALETLERQQGGELSLSTKLSDLLKEAQAAPQVLPPMLREVIEGPLSSLATRLEATTRADRALRPRPPSCQVPTSATRASDNVVETLEELALQLDALTGRATLEEMKDVAEHLGKLRQEIRRLAENLRKRPSEETRQALAARTEEFRRQLARLSQLAGTLGDEVLDEHVNEYALGQEKRGAILDRLGRDGTGSGDPLDALDRMVSQLQQAVSQGIDRFRQVMPISGEAARTRQAQGLASLAEAQRHLSDTLLEAKDPQALADRQRELGAKARRMAEKMSTEEGTKGGPRDGERKAEEREGVAEGRDSERDQGTEAEAAWRESLGGTMREVARRMDEAAGSLDRGERQAARDRGAEALRTLERLREAVERSGRLTPPPEVGGDGLDDRAAVEIPAAGGALPRKLRQSIQEAGRARWPKLYEGSLRRYYERLLR